MNQTLDRTFESRKRAERNQLGHDRRHDVADLELGHDFVPLLGRGTADRETNLLGLFVDLRDVDIDRLADAEHRLWVDIAFPTQLGEVRQAISAAQVDEHTE